MFKSLIQSSSHLSGLSLEAFIGDVTAEGQNYAFYELLSHPNIHTISPEIKSVVELFAKEEYQHYRKNRNRYPELNVKQISTLKKLTVLDILAGANVLSLLELESKLHLARQQLIDLLMRMNIEGTIQIKIDEKNETIKIANAERRNKKISHQMETALRQKIHLIMNDLSGLKGKIANIKDHLQNDKKNERKNDSNIDIEGM